MKYVKMHNIMYEFPEIIRFNKSSK